MASELLKGLRMLDLADEKGALCGKILADLGVEVIKVEPPKGCSTRRIPPFLGDRSGPDRSLYFLAYAAGKRSVTCDLESAEARAAFASLAEKSDFLVESFPVGYMDSIGLGYEALRRLNPRLIYVAITPFGETGPGRHYKAYDLVAWAAGGMMYLMGEEGRPPLQISFPQAGLHAGGEAAVAALMAHHARTADGLGQRIVVNMQACVVWTLMNEQAMPILHGDHLHRSGVFVGSADARRKMVYRCKDGHVSILVAGGPLGGASTGALVAWMAERNAAPEWMVKKDWISWVPGMLMKMTDRDRWEIKDMEEKIQAFFMTMSKREIYGGALRRRILLAPASSVADIAADEQLKAREFWTNVDCRETVGRELTFPGPFAKLSATPIGAPRRAPLLGEHNQEVYGALGGLATEQIEALRARGAI